MRVGGQLGAMKDKKKGAARKTRNRIKAVEKSRERKKGQDEQSNLNCCECLQAHSAQRDCENQSRRRSQATEGRRIEEEGKICREDWLEGSGKAWNWKLSNCMRDCVAMLDSRERGSSRSPEKSEARKTKKRRRQLRRNQKARARE